MRVLIVDDDITTRNIVASILRQEGYDVIIAVDGEEANHILQQPDTPQLIILDWLMPHVDGLAVLQQIRSTTTNAPPYVLMLTSKATETDMATSLAAGANDYLIKPFKVTELRTRIAAGRRMVEMQTHLNAQLEALQFQSRFHQIAAEISALLAAVSDEDSFDTAVNQALQQLGELFTADRSYLFRFSADMAHMSNTHEWCAPGIMPQIERGKHYDIDAMPWWKRQMLAKTPVQVTNMAELPPEADAEKEEFIAQNIRSLLVLPTVGADGQLTGFMGFDMVKHTYCWTDGQIAMLQPVANAMGSTLERLRAKEALHESERRYRALFEQSHDAVFLVDLSGSHMEVNQRAGELFGYTPEEIMEIGIDALSVQPAASRDTLQRLLAGEHIPTYERQFYAKDGRIITVELNVEVVHDADGQPRHIQSIARDVTERKKMETALRENEALLNEVGRLTKTGGWQLDTDTQAGRWTETTSLIHELPPSYQPSLADALNFYHPDDRERVATAVQRALEYGESFDLEARFTTATGKQLWCRAIGQLQQVNGRTAKLTGVFQDITERKQAEAALRQSHEELLTAQEQLVQQERMAAVGQLAAGIAHDFNNMLAIIMLYAQMMKSNSDLAEWETKAVTIIDEQTKMAAKMVQQILDFGRRSMMEKRPLNLLPLLQEQVALLTRTLPDNVTVTLTTHAPGPYMVCADATRLQQIVLNLAVNARDAMPSGGALRFELDKFDLAQANGKLTAGSWLRLCVSDTGQGIPEDKRAYIFEPFFTTKPPGKGSGLGLSQTQGIVLQHDGHIKVETAVNKGTTFTIYLPTIADAEETAVVAAPTTPSGAQQTILLVEDNPVVRQALVESLQGLNYQVTAVANGQEALDLLQANADEVDIILSDLVMPAVGGTQLFQQVQQQTQPIPMVIITGHQMDKELNELVAQGLTGWLTKPVNLDDLATLLQKAI